jgi:hypothetical protein
LGRVGSQKSAQEILTQQSPAAALLDLADALKNVTAEQRPFIVEQLKAIGLSQSLANAVLSGRKQNVATMAQMRKRRPVVSWSGFQAGQKYDKFLALA